MAVGFPYATGDILTAADMNGMVAFTINAQPGGTYTLASTDQYQVLIGMSNASAKTVYIPTDATYNFPIGTAITILNTGAAAATITATTSGTTTVVSAGATPASPTVAQYKMAVAIKTSANSWVVAGAVA